MSRTVPRTAHPGRIIAHRGASAAAPENTLAAFRVAAEQGADWIEFDVSLLGDGTPVIHHDATLDRCTDRSGPLSELRAGDLAGIDSGSWFGPAFAGEPMATLDATLDLIETLGLFANLEMKPHGGPPEPIAAAVADALGRRPWAAERVVTSSFDHGAIHALRRISAGLPLALLYDEPTGDWKDAAAAVAAEAIHINHKSLDADLLEEAAQAGLSVRVFTVNDPGRVAPYRNMGLTSVITDAPPLFLSDPDWKAWAAS